MHDIVEQPKEGEDSTPIFNESLEDDFEVTQQPQPSRSGITSSFVIDSANRVRILQTMSDARSNSFVATDAPQPVRPSRTNNWQEVRRVNVRSHSRSPRSERHIVRTNFGVVEISNTSERRMPNNREETASELGERDGHVESMRDEVSYARERDVEQDYRIPRSNPQMNDWRRRNMLDNSNFSAANVELHVSSTDVWEALVAIREARLRREREREFYPSADRRSWLSRSNSGVTVNMPARSSHTVVIIGDRSRPQGQNRQGPNSMYAIPRNHKIHQNVSRLTHYIEEPNVGSGYIKELCFSADGRLICSPFGYGVRLLAFSSDCQELSNCVPSGSESVKLSELAANVSHSDIVVSTKFSPRHYLLVSGCLSGKIVWHQPVV